MDGKEVKVYKLKVRVDQEPDMDPGFSTRKPSAISSPICSRSNAIPIPIIIYTFSITDREGKESEDREA